jgi:2-dehydropantoate 2-reductase
VVAGEGWLVQAAVPRHHLVAVQEARYARPVKGMKICVYGAGAVGGYLAGCAARGGADVSVIARGQQLAAIAARGLQIRTLDGAFHSDVTASADPAALGVQDAVIVAVKAPSLPDVAAGIAPLLGPDTAVVFAMNGIPWWYFHELEGPFAGRRLPKIDPGDAVWTAVGPQRAIGGVVYAGVTVIEPGTIALTGYRACLVLGEPDGRITPRVQAIADIIAAGGMMCDVTPRIRDVIWAKLCNNLGSGPMGVLTHSGSQKLYADPVLAHTVYQISAEVTAIAAAMGCSIKPDPEAQIAAARTSQHIASVVQDLMLGRPMEIDAIFRTPLELARIGGVATPVLDLLVSLATARARAAGLYAG